MDLAYALGKSIDEILDMPNSHLGLWVAYFNNKAEDRRG